MHFHTQQSFLHTNSITCKSVYKDGTYTGFIKVHFQLLRPISLPPSRSQSWTDEDDQRDRLARRRTSFYLPKNAAKHLHVSSETRVREVIEALLNKFTVVDNPAKFALFERAEKQRQGRIPDIRMALKQKRETCIIIFVFSFSVHA